MPLTDDQKAEVATLRSTARSLRLRAHLSIEEAEQCEAAADKIDPPQAPAPAPAEATPEPEGA